MTKSTGLPSQFNQFQNKVKLRTIADAVNDRGAIIRVLAKSNSPAEVRAFTILQIRALLKMLNVGKTMDANQVIQLSEMIYLQKDHLTLVDLKYCFEGIIAGRYGKIYDRIDPNIIMDAINQFEAEKAAFIEQEYLNKKNEQNGFIHPEVAEKIKGIFEQPPKPKEVKRELNPETLRAQEIMKEFDELYLEQYRNGTLLREFTKDGIETVGMRYVFFDGKMYTSSEFLTMKLISNENRND